MNFLTFHLFMAILITSLELVELDVEFELQTFFLLIPVVQCFEM